MGNFREENAFFIYYINFFGLYMTIPDSLLPKQWIKWIVILWTKFPLAVLPVYILWDVRALISDEMTILERFAMVRKVFVFSGFYLKNVIFYWNRKKIEGLIDLWDSFFAESFYPEEDLVKRLKNRKKNKKILRASFALAIGAAMSYTLPGFFKKRFTHPSGIVVPLRSPDFEIAQTFDTLAASSAISAPAFDCVLVVFLSEVRSKLEFLQERLAYIINEIIIDDEGRLLGRISNRKESENAYEETDLKSEDFLRRMENIDGKLRTWIHHHQQTISFFEELRKVYSNTATFELGYIIIYTSLTALNLVQMKLGLVALGIGLVASSNLLSLFLWCKISGDLGFIDSFGEAFERAWFLLPKKMKTAFSFIIMRSKKPLTLYGFSIYAISLVTFFEILKITYQFFAFMVQITSSEK